MMWPTHDNVSEYFMDIGTHMVEKNGLYLERYAIWSQNSSLMANGNIFLVAVICLIKVIAGI